MQTTYQFFNFKQLSDPASVSMANFHIGGPTVMIEKLLIEIFSYNWFTPPKDSLCFNMPHVCVDACVSGINSPVRIFNKDDIDICT